MKTATPNLQFTIHQSCTSALVLLWGYTAISKLTQFKAYSAQMHMQAFSQGLADLLIWMVPALELLAIILLLTNRTRIMGLWLSMGLLSAFTVYIILVLLNFYDHVPCSCGGVLESMTWNMHLWFNLFFITINWIAIKSGRGDNPS